MKLFPLFRRFQKRRNFREWILRWETACKRSWEILSSGPPSASRFRRWEKTHLRLMRLAEKKLHKTPQNS
jgi:hypothetical protein